jgi:S1-C subfamily serine protease
MQEADDEGGVLLRAVTRGAAAEQAGLRAGDVILSFDGVRTRTFEELQDAVQQADGPVKVVFINGENGETEYLTVEPEEGLIGVTCE